MNFAAWVVNIQPEINALFAIIHLEMYKIIIEEFTLSQSIQRKFAEHKAN